MFSNGVNGLFEVNSSKESILKNEPSSENDLCPT
jgi:hypothetical protein